MKTNITLYIDCSDIEKAVDKVSRLLLFKKLIKCGMGYTISKDLKSVYATTSCILTIQGKYSPQFNTTCGIRQDAPSSSLLFIIFITDMIDYIRNRCVNTCTISAQYVRRILGLPLGSGHGV